MRLRLTRPATVDSGIAALETAIYLVVSALLVTAGAFTLVGTIVDIFRGADSRAITDTGIFLLDRVLLLFIIAELLYTLRLVNIGGHIVVEPFLFIGLIAVVRRVLVLTAEFEGGHQQVQDFVLQIGALAALALVLVASIYVLRRSSAETDGGPEPPGPHAGRPDAD